MLTATPQLRRKSLCLIVIPCCLYAAVSASATTTNVDENARETSSARQSGDQAAMLTDFAKQERGLSDSISNLTGFSRLRGLSRRGDLRMFLGNLRGALEDYSEMITIDAAQDTPHWRRGIAYYFNKRFQEGADQFERYHAYDARDRENGLWKFLCDVQSKGLAHAQSKMLPYKQFDRHPFPQLYALYGGSLSLADYNEAVRPHAESSRMVKFFHLYYRGLHVVTSDKKAGLADIRDAVSLFPADQVADTGPGYMWHCARLHLDFIERQ